MTSQNASFWLADQSLQKSYDFKKKCSFMTKYSVAILAQAILAQGFGSRFRLKHQPCNNLFVRALCFCERVRQSDRLQHTRLGQGVHLLCTLAAQQPSPRPQRQRGRPALLGTAANVKLPRVQILSNKLDICHRCRVSYQRICQCR